MMKNRFKILTVSLVAVIAISACAPTATSAPVIPTEAALPVPATLAPEIVSPVNTDTVIAATPSPVVEVLPVATSRGPDLEATDPNTVALASGGLQLVEFFRFT